MIRSDATPAPAGPGSALWRLVAMSLAGCALYGLASIFRDVPCWGLLFLVAAVAWPIWRYQLDVVLFERRAVLEGVTVDDSWVRRLFWSGRLTQVLQVLVALTWAVVLLALASLLGAEQWAVLAADVLLLSLIVGPVQRRVARQVRDGHVGASSRRWPLWAFNLVFLTLAFAAADFFLVGAPDTRGMAWQEVAEAAFGQHGLDAACAPAGWLVGVLATLERLAWHASQLVIPSLPDRPLKLTAWAFVLLHAGLVAYLFTRLQLGVVALLDRGRSGGGRRRDSTFSLAFVYTILFLALPYLYVTLKLADLDPAALEAGARRVVEWVSPCEPDPAARAALLGTLGQELEAARVAARTEAERAVDTSLDRLFAAVEQGVDRYLDWYFTVVGEYERLLAAAAGDFAGLMTERLEQELFEATGFADRLAEASHAIESAAQSELAAAAARLGQRAAAELQAADPCRFEGVSLQAFGGLGHDSLRAAVAATSGTAAGVVAAKLLAQEAGAAVAAKVAAKNTFKAAAAVAGKVTAKKGGSMLLSATAATAVCAPGGPLAVLCGVAAGALTWLAVDKALVEIDETLFRDQMRAELIETLAEQRRALGEVLKAHHAAAIDATALGVQAQIDSLFIPARDGL
jgi:hypothetical protein